MTACITRLATRTHLAVGFILLAFDVATITDPTVMGHYGIVVDTPESRIAIRAIVGGGEIAMALVLLTGARMGMTRRELNLVAATLLLGVGTVRIGSALFEGSALDATQPWREGMVEIAIGCVAAWAAWLSARR